MIEQGNETLAVVGHDKVRELVQDHVIQALDVFLGKLQIEPYGAALRAAAAPLLLHALNEKAPQLDAKLLLPPVDERRRCPA